MELLREFLTQMGALQQVWMPFVLALFVVGVVIWRVLKHHYQGRLDTKDELIKLKEERLQDYKDKLSGATPDEARARLDALEARIDALGPRKITVEQANRMRPFLDPHSGVKVEIASDAASADAAQFSRALAEVFRSSGWKLSLPTVLGLGNPPKTGVAIGIPDPANPAPQQRAIMDALTAAGIAYDLQVGRADPDEDTVARLTVTTPLDR